MSLGLSAVLLFVVTLVRFYFYKHKNFTKQVAIQRGYGFYSDSKSSGCVAPGNDCTVSGTETIVQKCIPNPNTGRGCLDEDGNETFQTVYKVKPCSNQCVSSSFTKRDDGVTVPDPSNPERRLQPLLGSGCNKIIDPAYGIEYTSFFLGDYDQEKRDYHLKVCIPDSMTGYYQKKLTCVSKDGVGTNNCNYECGSDSGTLKLQGLLNSRDTSELIQYYPLEDNYGGDGKRTCYDLNEVDQVEILNYTSEIPKDFVYPDVCYKHSPVHNLKDNIWPNFNPINTVLMNKKNYSHDSTYLELQEDDLKKIFTDTGNIVDPDYWIQNDYNSYVKVLLDEEMTILERSIRSQSFPGKIGEIVTEPVIRKNNSQTTPENSILDGIMYLKVTPDIPSDVTGSDFMVELSSVTLNIFQDTNSPPLCKSYSNSPGNPVITASLNDTYYVPFDMKTFFERDYYNINFNYQNEEVVTRYLPQLASSLNSNIIVYLNFEGTEFSGFFVGKVTELNIFSDTTVISLFYQKDNYLDSPELTDGLVVSKRGFHYTLPVNLPSETDFDSVETGVIFTRGGQNSSGSVNFEDSFVTDTVFMYDFYNQDPKTFRSAEFANQPMDYLDVKFPQTNILGEFIENYYVYGTIGGVSGNIGKQFWYPLKIDPSGTINFEEYGENYTFSFVGDAKNNPYVLPANTDLKDFGFYSGIARTRYQSKRIRDKIPFPGASESDYYFVTSLETITKGVGYAPLGTSTDGMYPLLHGSIRPLNKSIASVFREVPGSQERKHILKLVRSNSTYFINVVSVNPVAISHKLNKIREYFKMIENQKQVPTDDVIEESVGDNIKIVISPQKTLTQLADYRVFKSPYLLDTKGNYTFPCYTEQGVPEQKGKVVSLTEGDTLFINNGCTNYNTDRDSKCGVLGVSTSASGTSVFEFVQPRITQSTYFSEDCIPETLDNYTTVDSISEQGVIKKKLLRTDKFGNEENQDIMVFDKFFTREYDPEKKYATGEEFFINKHQVQFYVSLKNDNKDFISDINSWKRVFPFQNLTKATVYQDLFHSNLPLTQNNKFYTFEGYPQNTYIDRKVSVSDEILANFSIGKSGITTKNFSNTAISYFYDHFHAVIVDAEGANADPLGLIKDPGGNNNLSLPGPAISNSLFRRPPSLYYKLYGGLETTEKDTSSPDQLGEWTRSGLASSYKVLFKINNDYSSQEGSTFRARLFDQNLLTPFSDVEVGDKIHLDFGLFYNLFSGLEFHDNNIFSDSNDLSGSKDFIFSRYFETFIDSSIYNLERVKCI
jgi:hypothetical protein